MTTKPLIGLLSLPLFLAACGDGAICPSGTLVAISAPNNGDNITNADDRDFNLEGVQINVPVRTNLAPGSAVDLEIIVAGDSNETVILGAEVDDEGRAVFENVTLPFGTITLRASGAEDDCGDSDDGIEVEVIEALNPPPTVTGLQLEGLTRDSLRASWSGPLQDVAGYIVRYSETPLTENNFNITGIEISDPPSAGSGQAVELEVGGLRAGFPYFVGIATIDQEGTRSVVAIGGPVILALDQQVAIASPDAGANMAEEIDGGDLNGDSFADVAVSGAFADNGATSRAGRVYLFMGSATGLASTPDLTIEGTTAAGRLGSSIAVLDWNGDGLDDLAVGQPGLERVLVYFGPFTANLTDADADVVIGNRSGSAFSGLGTELEKIRFDSDARDDLVIGAGLTDAWDGGAIVLYGGATATSISLHETLSDAMGDAVGYFVRPLDGVGQSLGWRLSNLGTTEGAMDDNEDLGMGRYDDPRYEVLRGINMKPGSGLVEVSTDLVVADLIDEGPDPNTFGVSTYFGTASSGVGDINEDDVRDVAIGAWASGANTGRVVIVDGSLAGNQTVAGAALLTEILPSLEYDFLGVEVRGENDLDGDGVADLLVVGRDKALGVMVLFVWYGGELPLGTVTTNSAHYVEHGSFALGTPSNFERPAYLAWVGDVNDDGRNDLCWADFGGDGTFQLLWDE